MRSKILSSELFDQSKGHLSIQTLPNNSMSCREVIVSKKTVTIIFGIDKQLAAVTYVVHLDMNILINNTYNGWSNWFMAVIAFYGDIIKPLFLFYVEN